MIKFVVFALILSLIVGTTLIKNSTKDLDDKIWHYKHYGTTGISSNIEEKVKNSIRKEAYKGAMAEHNPVFVHFISKQLELAYK